MNSLQTGGSIHLSPNACRALASLELLPALQDHATVEHHITLMSYASGAVLRKLDLTPDMEDKYGFPYLSIGRVPLHQCLERAALKAGAVIKFGCIINSIDFDAPAVYLEDGRVFHADLVVGADGEFSQCRSLLLGRPDPPVHFGHSVFSASVLPSALSSKPDLTRLIENPGIVWWMGPGTMALASTRGKDHVVDVMGGLIETEDKPVQARPLPISKEDIKLAFEGWDPAIMNLVSTADQCFKWTSTVTAMLEEWCHPSGRFLLIGDAAHAMTPYLAQGASSSLEDAAALETILSKVHDSGQIPEAVRVFHDMRQPRCRRLKEVSLGLRDVYCMRDGPSQELRDRDLLHGLPGPGFVIPWFDPEFQGWVYGYDSVGEAHRAWMDRA